MLPNVLEWLQTGWPAQNFPLFGALVVLAWAVLSVAIIAFGELLKRIVVRAWSRVASRPAKIISPLAPFTYRPGRGRERQAGGRLLGKLMRRSQ